MKWLALFGAMALLSGCSDAPGPAGGQTPVAGGRQPTVRASAASASQALAILSKATFLDNLIAGERRPAGEGVWAFNVLLHAPDPGASFDELFATRKHVAQAYALVGLKMAGAGSYAAATEAFKKDPRKYEYGFGCMGMNISNTEFVELIDTGRLKSAYMVIAAFDPYLENRDLFLKESGKFMVNTAGGL
jgi:hypothetical protein